MFLIKNGQFLVRTLVLFAFTLIKPILENLLSYTEPVDYTFLSVFGAIFLLEAFVRGKAQTVYNHLGIRFSKAVATSVIQKLVRLRFSSLSK